MNKRQFMEIEGKNMGNLLLLITMSGICEKITEVRSPF